MKRGGCVYIMTNKNNTTLYTGEKQIKAGSRKKKEALINTMNPDWKDLHDEVLEWQNYFVGDVIAGESSTEAI